jgi:hypothetical protein
MPGRGRRAEARGLRRPVCVFSLSDAQTEIRGENRMVERFLRVDGGGFVPVGLLVAGVEAESRICRVIYVFVLSCPLGLLKLDVAADPERRLRIVLSDCEQVHPSSLSLQSRSVPGRPPRLFLRPRDLATRLM